MDNSDVDGMEFFRQITLRICGSLDIEKALFNTFCYIGRYIPADEVSYTHFEADMGAIKFVACATQEGGKDLGLTPMPLSPQLAAWLKKDIPKADAYFMNRPSDNPLVDAVTKFRGMDIKTSILVTRLMLDGQFLGSFNVACNGIDRYTKKHLNLISSVQEPLAIALANCLRHREVLRLKELGEEDNQYLKDELNSRLSKTIVGAEFGLKRVMTKVRQVAGSVSPVLLQGETGTGKEVVANAIHNLSPRANGPFVTINCGAIPSGLVDSELFGHEKGAFTGAISSYRGRFERATSGTIFLDEIGELPLEAQVRLLRVLQEREIERIGSTETTKVDIRVIAATHRNLDDMVSNGGFRQDLLYRLKVFPIVIPPLRERKSDIPALVQHFFQKKGRELGVKRLPEIMQAFLDRLLSYDWPGNVRELENHIERYLILNRREPLPPEQPKEIKPALEYVQIDKNATPILPLDKAMKRHIQKAMEHCHGQIEGSAGVANLLQIKPNTLRARMRKLGIEYGRRRKQTAGIAET
jgi:transcriptional regulator with GAF, ATPase, and Fis domain